ncbi:methyltransferase [Reticulibacter mediterranei]|uniref:Methyltransferase n=1 Tax=Reticulibacter mediterranei TaxID=2778369 RepID=A0A8J3IXT4_9CHLR|nr:methyltransferase [Reticulibacter mediterranei]GHO99889.1 methyltransferase [Reticulibacter mediterranei]
MTTESVVFPPILVPPPSDDHLIWEVWLSSQHFSVLTVTEELGLFPLLARSPATAEEVAHSLTLALSSTQALLGILTSLGFLAQHQKHFHLTEVSRTYLLPDSPYYYGPALHLFCKQPMAHETLRAVLQNRQTLTTFDEEVGNIADAMQAGDIPSARAEALTQVVYCYSLPAALAVAQSGNFVGVRRLLDVGGGSGCFCIALAQHYAEMSFCILELPSICPITQRYIAAYGLEHRIDTRAANMFLDAWPTGYDAVFFSNILHMWDRQHCLQLVRRSFEMLPPGGRIYLHEMLLNEAKDGPLTATDFSLLAFSMSLQGQQYSARELTDLLREAGFTLPDITATSTSYSLISALKPV